MDEVMEGALVSEPTARLDATPQELLEGTTDPGVQISQ